MPAAICQPCCEPAPRNSHSFETLTLWGGKQKKAKRLRAGIVWINCHNVFDAALPFGGYKQSGRGREMGEEVLHNYTEVKAVTTAL